MSELLDRAIAQIRTLPSEAQDEVARLPDWTNDIAGAPDELSVKPIDPKDLAAIEKDLADARAGRVASKEDVEAAFALFRPAR